LRVLIVKERPSILAGYRYTFYILLKFCSIYFLSSYVFSTLKNVLTLYNLYWFSRRSRKFGKLGLFGIVIFSFVSFLCMSLKAKGKKVKAGESKGKEDKMNGEEKKKYSRENENCIKFD